MNDMKWAWALFVAASLAILIRTALWFRPERALEHVERVEAAVAAESPEALLAESPEVVPAEPEVAWPDEAVERTDWLPPPVPLEIAPLPAEMAPTEAPPEEYHLRRTRWGMTLAEVRAAEAGEPLRESERGLMYATSTLELPCLLTYSFVQGGLVRARLAFSDPAGRDLPPLGVAQAQRRFLYLREQLESRYGEPVLQTVHLPRDVSGLRRTAQKQAELAQQYDAEIAEAEVRLKKQRELLERRYERWPNRTELVARGLKPHERDLRDLRAWKQEALALGEQSRRSIDAHRAADAAQPLVATMTARWPHARGIQDIELKLDLRGAVPRLDIRYEGARELPGLWQVDEL